MSVSRPSSFEIFRKYEENQKKIFEVFWDWGFKGSVADDKCFVLTDDGHMVMNGLDRKLAEYLTVLHNQKILENRKCKLPQS